MGKNLKLQFAIKEKYESQYRAFLDWGISECRISNFISRRMIPTISELRLIETSLGKSLESLGFTKDEIEKAEKNEKRRKNDKRSN